MADLLATSPDTWRDRSSEPPVVPAELVPPQEGSVSDHRIRVQQVMDACNEEIGRRYRDGSASIDELLARERQA